MLLKDVARVGLGPEIRRGVSDLDGTGDAVGGIVVMRHGENALNVIQRVKEKLHDLGPSLPAGVEIVTTYDRADLITRAIDTLKHELNVEMIIVSLVILLFLWHIPSAIVPILTIPISVLLAFIPLYYFGVTVNIMSLAGIAISIGVLVDGAIVEVENAYNKLHLWDAGGRKGDFHAVRLEALKEVGPSVFFSLLVDGGGVPAHLRPGGPGGPAVQAAGLLQEPGHGAGGVPGHHPRPGHADDVHPHGPLPLQAPLPGPARHATPSSAPTTPRRSTPSAGPSSRSTTRPAAGSCGAPGRPSLIAVAIVAVSIPAYFRLGSEFMPPLNEGTILYMPTTLPGHLGGRGPGAAADAGPGPQVVPRGGAGVRQGRTRRDLHRPGALLDDGDHGDPEAAAGVARQGPLVLRPGRRASSSGCSARSGPTGSRGTSWSPRWTGSCGSPA